jgi:hypothetical protein
MRRRRLLGDIAREARATGKAWTMLRQGGGHEIWACGETKVSIPRHNEVNELTALRIMQALEAELRDGWWR